MEIRRTGIYKITSPNGKVYIGQSRNLTKRLNKYKNNNCLGQAKLHASITKHGWDEMIFEIVHVLPNDVSQKILNNYESLYIELYKNCNFKLLNLTEGGGHKGPMSEETKRKLSIAHTGKKLSQETIEKMRVHRFGKKPSPEAIEKLRQRNIGNKYSLGRKLTDEHKQKIAQKNTGVQFSSERRKKISISQLGNKKWLGKKHNKETKIKISVAIKNALISKQTNKFKTES